MVPAGAITGFIRKWLHGWKWIWNIMHFQFRWATWIQYCAVLHA